MRALLISTATILFVLINSANAYRKVIDLGPGIAYSINDSGQIVGWNHYDPIDPEYHGHAVLFDSTGDGANIDLGTLGGNESSACSINNAGQIVGCAYDSSGKSHACLFSSTPGRVNISLEEKSSVANCINNSGEIVGHAQDSSGYIHAYRFDVTGGQNNLDLASGGYKNSDAFFINDPRQIVGWINVRIIPPPPGPDPYIAFLFEGQNKGRGLDLSRAFGINDNGLVVGYRGDLSNLRACLSDSTKYGSGIELGTLGTGFSIAYSINNHNQIVGKASGFACLFDLTGQGNNINLKTLIDPTSGWILREAFSINNNGWIVGYGTHNGDYRAFLLTPEPTSALLFTLGALFVASRRKKR